MFPTTSENIPGVANPLWLFNYLFFNLSSLLFMEGFFGCGLYEL